MNQHHSNNALPIATLKLPRTVAGVIAFATSVADAMTDNPYFPEPHPPISTMRTRIAAVEAAEAVVATGLVGARKERDEKVDDLKRSLLNQRGYVQGVACTNRESAGDVIVSGEWVRPVALLVL